MVVMLDIAQMFKVYRIIEGCYNAAFEIEYMG